MSADVIRAMFAAAPEERRGYQEKLVDAAERTSTGQAWYWVALGHTLIEEHEAAVPILEALLAHAPAWEEAKFCLARAYAGCVNPFRAIECFQSLQARGSDRVRKMVPAELEKMREAGFGDASRLSHAVAQRANALVHAIANPSRPAIRDSLLAAFGRLLELDPDDIAVLNAQAFALAACGKREDACQVIERLLMLAPDNVDVRLNIAETARILTLREVAREHYTWALDLGRDEIDQEFVRERLASLDEEPLVVFGEWVALRELGAGSMGHVWLVEHRTTRERAALKRTLAPDPILRAALVHELQAQIDLELHPHIVKLVGVRTNGDEVGVLSELVDGAALSEWIETRPARGEVIDAIVQMALGLEAIHHTGFAHLDVKPGNAIRGADGIVKVGDFAFAGSATDLLGELFGKERVVPIGTPAYQSPEQAARHKRTWRPSDVWSMGMSALHLLAGEVSWMNGAAGATIAKSLDDTIVDSRLRAILMPCFDSDPAKRPSMTDLVDRLLAYQTTMTGRTRPRPPLPEPRVGMMRTPARDLPPQGTPEYEALIERELALQNERRAEDERADYHDPTWWFQRIGAHEAASEHAGRHALDFLGGRGVHTLHLDGFERAAELAARRLPPMVAGIRADAARLHHRLGDHVGAVAQCRLAELAAGQHANEFEPRFHGGRAARLRGVIHLAAGDRRAAFDAFAVAIAALETLPLEARYRIELGLALAMQAQLLHVALRRHEAITYAERAERALTVDRPDAQAHRERVRAMVASWRAPEAIE